MDYSQSLVGSLVKVPKNIVALAIDSSGQQTVIRVKEKSLFLILSLIESEPESTVPEMWKTMNLYKVLPVTYESYDEFLFPVKNIPSSIFVDADHLFLWSENT